MNLNNYAFSKDEFERRFYSILWHGGIMMAVALLDLFGQSLELFNLPTWLIGILVVVVPQITKWLRNYYDEEALIAYAKAHKFERDEEVKWLSSTVKEKKTPKTPKKKSSKTAKTTKKSGKK